MQAPQVILLKEGTDTSQGKPQLISNINACTAVGDVVRTTLGPRGMDKLIHDDKVRDRLPCPLTTCRLLPRALSLRPLLQGNVTISNDGATIMQKLEVVHPAAKTLVDISLSQDSEVRACHPRALACAAEHGLAHRSA